MQTSPQSATELQITRMSDHVGGEVHGIDLTQPLDTETVNGLWQALPRYGLLVFRNQSVSPADHVRFARAFGSVVINKYFDGVDGFPEIANVERTPDDQDVTGTYWHTDHSYDAEPALGSVFVARVVPPEGGDTLFAGVGAATADLPNNQRTQLEALSAWHSDAACPELADAAVNESFSSRLTMVNDACVHSRHPMIIRHPVSGQAILYVNPGFTEGIDGMPPAESADLLRLLYDHVTQPRYTYRHTWAAGDVAFWDNRAVWHHATDDHLGHHRVFHRITIDGTPLLPYAVG